MRDEKKAPVRTYWTYFQVLPRNEFAFYLTPLPRQNSIFSVGGIEPSLVEGQIEMFPVSHEKYWSLDLADVSLGDTEDNSILYRPNGESRFVEELTPPGLHKTAMLKELLKRIMEGLMRARMQRGSPMGGGGGGGGGFGGGGGGGGGGGFGGGGGGGGGGGFGGGGEGGEEEMGGEGGEGGGGPFGGGEGEGMGGGMGDGRGGGMGDPMGGGMGDPMGGGMGDPMGRGGMGDPMGGGMGDGMGGGMGDPMGGGMGDGEGGSGRVVVIHPFPKRAHGGETGGDGEGSASGEGASASLGDDDAIGRPPGGNAGGGVPGAEDEQGGAPLRKSYPDHSRGRRLEDDFHGALLKGASSMLQVDTSTAHANEEQDPVRRLWPDGEGRLAHELHDWYFGSDGRVAWRHLELENFAEEIMRKFSNRSSKSALSTSSLLEERAILERKFLDAEQFRRAEENLPGSEVDLNHIPRRLDEDSPARVRTVGPETGDLLVLGAVDQKTGTVVQQEDSAVQGAKNANKDPAKALVNSAVEMGGGGLTRGLTAEEEAGTASPPFPPPTRHTAGGMSAEVKQSRRKSGSSPGEKSRDEDDNSESSEEAQTNWAEWESRFNNEVLQNILRNVDVTQPRTASGGAEGGETVTDAVVSARATVAPAAVAGGGEGGGAGVASGGDGGAGGEGGRAGAVEVRTGQVDLDGEGSAGATSAQSHTRTRGPSAQRQTGVPQPSSVGKDSAEKNAKIPRAHAPDVPAIGERGNEHDEPSSPRGSFGDEDFENGFSGMGGTMSHLFGGANSGKTLKKLLGGLVRKVLDRARVIKTGRGGNKESEAGKEKAEETAEQGTSTSAGTTSTARGTGDSGSAARSKTPGSSRSSTRTEVSNKVTAPDHTTDHTEQTTTQQHDDHAPAPPVHSEQVRRRETTTEIGADGSVRETTHKVDPDGREETIIRIRKGPSGAGTLANPDDRPPPQGPVEGVEPGGGAAGAGDSNKGGDGGHRGGDGVGGFEGTSPERNRGKDSEEGWGRGALGGGAGAAGGGSSGPGVGGGGVGARGTTRGVDSELDDEASRVRDEEHSLRPVGAGGRNHEVEVVPDDPHDFGGTRGTGIGSSDFEDSRRTARRPEPKQRRHEDFGGGSLEEALRAADNVLGRVLGASVSVLSPPAASPAASLEEGLGLGGAYKEGEVLGEEAPPPPPRGPASTWRRSRPGGPSFVDEILAAPGSSTPGSDSLKRERRFRYPGERGEDEDHDQIILGSSSGRQGRAANPVSEASVSEEEEEEKNDRNPVVTESDEEESTNSPHHSADPLHSSKHAKDALRHRINDKYRRQERSWDRDRERVDGPGSGSSPLGRGQHSHGDYAVTK